MSFLKLRLSAMANGGQALGRDTNNRVIFVPQAIPGELVEVEVDEQTKGHSQAQLRRVLQPSAERVSARCDHFPDQTCSHFQHIAYPTQLHYKKQVILDQMKRLAGLEPLVRPLIASPAQWGWQTAVSLSPTAEGGFGLWSGRQQKVLPIAQCALLTPGLQNLMQDLDMELPGLRRLTLREGSEGDLLVAMEIEDVEPPDLVVDFPLSAAIVLPDQTAANLIGDNFVVQVINGRPFQVSAGCYFHANPAATEQVTAALLTAAQLRPSDKVLELFSGVGVFTAALAAHSAEVIGIEANSDAVEDAAINLDDTEQVSLYHAFVEDVLPSLKIAPPVVVMHPPAGGLSAEIIRAVVYKRPQRLIYISDDVATLARDAKMFGRSGYRLAEIQPIDTAPQTYHMTCVALFLPQK
ncbi:MAG: class I SAM-dependent RNA methyltransferase [Chloroflexi bacterium]|nr:class I SAM-dependent RNA methyltransferase [Chloroflexota bacterium]